MPTNTLTSLARVVHTTRYADFSPTTIHKMKIHLLDTLGVSLAGAHASETARVIAGLGITTDTMGTTHIWGTPYYCDARTAAFVNGVAAHAYELDDSGGCDHSGAVVIPAAVATIANIPTPLSGESLLRSLILGYEVARRVLEACGGYEAHNGLGWHSTGTCGVFGSASAVALLRGSSADQLAHALGIAGSFAGGTWSFIHDGSQTKKLHAGRAAEAGVMAANLALAQFSGPQALFQTGTWGSFFDTFGGGQHDESALLTQFGAFWRINRCSIKPYATCRGSHSGIDAINIIMSTNQLVPTDIATIHIAISAFQYGMCGSTHITTRAEAQMSLPYALAARLHYGKVFLAELADTAWGDPSIAHWLSHTSVQIDPQMSDDAEPAITVTTHAGAHYTQTVDHPLGGPQNPLSDAQVIAKFRDLVAPVITTDTSEQIIRLVLDLEHCRDVKDLCALL
jgi:2-methylcitrate dehydratase PrpD